MQPRWGGERSNGNSSRGYKGTCRRNGQSTVDDERSVKARHGQATPRDVI